MNPITMNKEVFMVSLYLFEDSIKGIIKKKEMKEIAVKSEATNPTWASALRKLLM